MADNTGKPKAVRKPAVKATGTRKKNQPPNPSISDSKPEIGAGLDTTIPQRRQIAAANTSISDGEEEDTDQKKNARPKRRRLDTLIPGLSGHGSTSGEVLNNKRTAARRATKPVTYVETTKKDGPGLKDDYSFYPEEAFSKEGSSSSSDKHSQKSADQEYQQSSSDENSNSSSDSNPAPAAPAAAAIPKNVLVEDPEPRRRPQRAAAVKGLQKIHELVEQERPRSPEIRKPREYILPHPISPELLAQGAKYDHRAIPKHLAPPPISPGRIVIDDMNVHALAEEDADDPWASAYAFRRYKDFNNPELSKPRRFSPYRELHNISFPPVEDTTPFAENVRWAKQQFKYFGSVWLECESSLATISQWRREELWVSESAIRFKLNEPDMPKSDDEDSLDLTPYL